MAPGVPLQNPVGREKARTVQPEGQLAMPEGTVPRGLDNTVSSWVELKAGLCLPVHTTPGVWTVAFP